MVTTGQTCHTRWVRHVLRQYVGFYSEMRRAQRTSRQTSAAGGGGAPECSSSGLKTTNEFKMKPVAQGESEESCSTSQKHPVSSYSHRVEFSHREIP